MKFKTSELKNIKNVHWCHFIGNPWGQISTVKPRYQKHVCLLFEFVTIDICSDKNFMCSCFPFINIINVVNLALTSGINCILKSALKSKTCLPSIILDCEFSLRDPKFLWTSLFYRSTICSFIDLFIVQICYSKSFYCMLKMPLSRNNINCCEYWKKL